MRTRLGCSTYYMRRWLRLLWCSQLLSSYPLPMSMLSLGGINHNSSTLDSNYISWNYLKKVLDDAKYSTNIVNIVNSCISPSYWLSHFKMSLSIIIPKSLKSLYNISKVFCLIVLLNMLKKLIKNIISNRLQVHSITSNFIHSN